MEPDKRKFARKRTDQLLYAEFGPDNGSILLNLSEEGCSFQSLAPVRGEQVRFSVSVGDGRKLEGQGDVIWSDSGKRTGGVRFLNPSSELQEQVRAWLKQTLVTTEGKLDPVAVESEARRRRKKLRDEAKTAAEQTKTIAEASTAPADVVAELIAAEQFVARRVDVNSKGRLFRVCAIGLAAILLVVLVTYRRDLGHLVMLIGSSIAGEKGSTATPAEVRPEPVNTSAEVKQAVIPVSHETATESTAGDGGNNADTAAAESVSATEVSSGPAKHAPIPQGASTVEDVPALWTSVENGDMRAEVMLAGRYVRGDGVPQSCAQARVLLEAATKRGSSEAKQKLGELGKAGCP